MTQVEVEKLITPAQIKNFIAKNKLDAIVIEPRSDGELTELDVMEKKTIVVRMKEIGKGRYDSIITVYRDGESKGSFDCRSVSSNPAKWVSIQEGYYWAVRHQHKGEYWALQLRSPSVRRTKVEKKTVYNKKTNKNEIVDVNVFSEEEETMRAYSVIPIAKGELPASEDKYAVDRAIPILQDTNPLTKKDHASGINIHYGGSKGQTNSSCSMGCQLIYTPTWDDFYEIIKTRKDGTIYNMWVIR